MRADGYLANQISADAPAAVYVAWRGNKVWSKTPQIEAIDQNGIWDISEAVWIDRMRHDGHPLLNIASVIAD